MDMEHQIILFRMAERVGLTILITCVALVVMVAFRRGIQKIDLKPSDATLGIGGSVVLATPVFILLSMILYAWVTLSHPISVSAVPASAEDGGEQVATIDGAPAFIGFGPDNGRDGAIADRREDALAQIRSLNCLAPDPDALSPEVRADLDSLKLALLEPVWSNAWGEYASFSAWVALGTGAPPAVIEALWSQGHGTC